MLLIKREESIIVEMDETQVMAAATSLALLSNKRQRVAVFEEGIGDLGIAKPHEEAAALVDLRPLHVAGNVFKPGRTAHYTPYGTSGHISCCNRGGG